MFQFYKLKSKSKTKTKSKILNYKKRKQIQTRKGGKCSTLLNTNRFTYNPDKKLAYNVWGVRL